MFRLVKVLNGNTQGEVRLVDSPKNALYLRGEAVISSSGSIATPTSISVPDYIYLSCNTTSHPDKVYVMLVTENSVFKVEYVGAIKPYVGMPVGLATHTYRMDAVTYNSNGKGTVLDVDETGEFVFVRFRK